MATNRAALSSILSSAIVLTCPQLQARDYQIMCGDQLCSQSAEMVTLPTRAESDVIYHHLIDTDVLIPLPADPLSAIGSPVTAKPNSFTVTYYYNDQYSVGLFFLDEDMNEKYDLLAESNRVYQFEIGEINGYFFESTTHEGNPLAPIFKALINVPYGTKTRYLTYMTQRLDESSFRSLIGSLQDQTNNH